MKRTTENRGTDVLTSSPRRDEQGTVASDGSSGPVAALHRTRGNQGVQSLAERMDQDERQSPTRPNGMCSRCLRRYRAGKPLNCAECEHAAGRGGPGPTIRGAPDETAVQPKLTVNEPDDRFEREAERVADRVMRAPERSADPDVRETEPDQRVQRTCSRCRRRHREGKPLDCEECEQVQRSTDGGSGGEPSRADAEAAVQSVQGGGEPLPDDTRSFFETRFGRDFGDVRVHTGPRADRANRALAAEAFTVGSDIAFASGNYRPDTESGRRLLAHELTHVVQQTGGQVAVQRQSNGDQETEGGGVELDTWADLWQRGGGMRTIGGGGMYVGAVYFSTDESTLDSDDKEALGRLVDQLSNALGQRDGNYTLRLVGRADERASEQYNLNLSMDRARSVSNFFALLSYYPNFSTETEGVGEFTREQQGETAEELAEFRRVDLILEPPMTREIDKPEPEEEEDDQPEGPECQPAKDGFPPSAANCRAYEQNSYWLPDEYVHNATCACTELPDSPTANCVRAHLQDRMAAVPQSTKQYWARIVAVVEGSERWSPFPNLGREAAEALIYNELTEVIYEHHVDAYDRCCCKGGPAPYPSWVGVVNVELPCSGVEVSIRNFGACGRGGW